MGIDSNSEGEFDRWRNSLIICVNQRPPAVHLSFKSNGMSLLLHLMGARDRNVATPDFRSFLHDSAAEREDSGVAFGGFGFGDVAVPNIHLGQAGPGEQVVWLERDGLEAAADGFFDLAGFQEGHAERVPAIEEPGIQRDTAPVEGDGFVEFADGKVAVGFVEEVLEIGPAHFL